MVNWEKFEGLPGSININFEMLCRSLIRRHYNRFGEFAALANQPGVEFHLKLQSECSLGEPGRWYGWQCRWYDLPSGRAIGTTRRNKIEEAINKTHTELPNLTDWILWTRHPLTDGDQQWYNNLQSHMRLHLWTMAEVEEHLSGPCEILRGTYFGELVLTPELLTKLHTEAVEPIKGRWQPKVHQVVNAERCLQSKLVTVEVWSYLCDIAERLEDGVKVIKENISGLPTDIEDEINKLVAVASTWAAYLTQTYSTLEQGDYEVLCQQLVNIARVDYLWFILLRKLRSGNHLVSLYVTNVIADMHSAYKVLTDLYKVLGEKIIAVVADAGCGKTQLAAQLTAPTKDRPAGMLLHGRDLHAGHSLNNLASMVVIHGNPVPSFEALVTALNAAGQRDKRRLPIVIDGLNEAEDPRDWKNILASASRLLQEYPYVMLVCTLRSAFVSESLPNNIDSLEIPGFERDTRKAVVQYFNYYRIDPTDAELPWQLLQHPLTLRMFCEVTNQKRDRVVGVEAMPSSLTTLFDKYLEQVAERIMELSPRTRRYYQLDIRAALNQIGLALWEEKSRSLDLEKLRRCLGDETRPWNESIVRALEHDGVLLRAASHQPNSNNVTVVYDMLAGHLVADALLDRFNRELETWIQEPDTVATLVGKVNERHPLASDILRALVGLAPRRTYGRQIWQLLGEPSRTEALYEAAWLDKAFLDHDTVSQLASLARSRNLFDRLLTTRGARFHPLNADFLDEVLRPMLVSNRDLHWSEWIRKNQKELIEDLQNLEKRWRVIQNIDQRDHLLARWVMWTLTTTVRLLRDYATRALYRFGCLEPNALFNLTIDALAVNDPYVPERMLAACYGVSMSLWADPKGCKLREALPMFANSLVDKMFIPNAPHPTCHVLMRDYALSVIFLTSKISQGCIPKDKLRYLRPPFRHLASPFPGANKIKSSSVVGAKTAIHMDFGNYTIGRLITKRRNYDFKNKVYQNVRKQIEWRIVNLGYSPSQFTDIDRRINEGKWHRNQEGFSTDRYGKKYSWIAYFEIYGIKTDQGKLPEGKIGERTSDVDIDPSFPDPPKTWKPLLPELFTISPTEPELWLTDGPTPNYDFLLYAEGVDGEQGKWVLLNGYIEQKASNDERQVFTFLRGLLAKRKEVGNLFAAFEALEYPGNMAIPDPSEDYYTYAGEISWSPRFGSTLWNQNGKAERNIQQAFVRHDGKRWLKGISIEVPVHEFIWESYHSELNQVSGIMVPAPALCEQLHLSNQQGSWDLYDSNGCTASIYREFKNEGDYFSSRLLFLRADLMKDYLAKTHQKLIWFVWGERGFDSKATSKLIKTFPDLFSGHKNIHRFRSQWEP